MSDLGLNEQHADIVAKYLTFTKLQRAQNLRTIDCLFQDVLDTRLLESCYTADEVSDILVGLRTLTQGEVDAGLTAAAHMNVLLLQQLCSQAERWHLRLEANMSELENRSLLEKVRQLETEGGASQVKPTSASDSEDQGPAALLHREISRLTKEIEEHQTTIASLQTQLETERQQREAMAGTLRDCEAGREEERLKLANAEGEVARVRELLSATPMQQTPQAESGGETEELLAAKASLQQVRAQLTLAEQELDRKFSETSAFTNLRRMLDTKNEQLREMRTRLAALEMDGENTQPTDD